MRSFWYFTFYSEFFITHKKKKLEIIMVFTIKIRNNLGM